MIIANAAFSCCSGQGIPSLNEGLLPNASKKGRFSLFVLAEVCPKFIAFKGPSAKRELLVPGLWSIQPCDYVEVFKERKVTAIVRLNEAETYNRWVRVRIFLALLMPPILLKVRETSSPCRRLAATSFFKFSAFVVNSCAAQTDALVN